MCEHQEEVDFYRKSWRIISIIVKVFDFFVIRKCASIVNRVKTVAFHRYFDRCLCFHMWLRQCDISRMGPALYLEDEDEILICNINLFQVYYVQVAINKKAVLSQGNRVMPQLFFSV